MAAQVTPTPMSLKDFNEQVAFSEHAHIDTSFAKGPSAGYGHVPSKVQFKELAEQQKDNYTGDFSIRGSNRPYVDPHSGYLSCACAHDLGNLQWPLAAGIHHLHNRCKWSCCGGSWEQKLCAHDNPQNEVSKFNPHPKAREYAFDSSLDPKQIEMGPGGRDAEFLGALKKSSAVETASTLLANKATFSSIEPKDLEENSEDARNQVDGAKKVFFPARDFDFSFLDPTPVVFGAGEGIVSGAAVVGTSTVYVAAVAADVLHNNLVQPFLSDPVSVPEELEEILVALIDANDDSKEEDLKALMVSAASLYLTNLELSDAQFDMIMGWIAVAVHMWQKCHGSGQTCTDVLTVKGESNMSFLDTLLVAMSIAPEEGLESMQVRCFKRDEIVCLKATTFVDWYVMHRFTRIKFTIPEVSGFPLFTERHTNGVAGALRAQPGLYTSLKDVRTQSSFSLERAIQSGIDYPTCPAGCIAGDSESYKLFKDLYTAVIVHANGIVPRQGDERMPVSLWRTGHKGRRDLDFSNISNLQSIDTLYVRACNVRGRRNIDGLSFPGHCSRAGRRKVEILASEALSSIKGEFEGTYTPLFASPEEAAKPAATMLQAGMARDWPFARGVFKSNDESLRVFVNGQDHFTIDVCAKSLLGRTQGCDVVSVMQKHARALATIEHNLYQELEVSFARSEEFGYFTSDVTQAGTGLRIEYSLKLVRLGSPTYNLPSICARLGLTCRADQTVYTGSAGELDPSLWFVAVAYSIGLSEIESMQLLIDGVATLIGLEKLLEKGESDEFAATIGSLPTKFVLLESYRAAKFDTETEEEHADHERIPVDSEDDFPVLTPAHTSVMAKYMTRELYRTLRTSAATTAASGWSLAQLIRVGVEIPGHSTGVLLGTAESYEAYKHLLAPMILNFHGFKSTGIDRDTHLTDLELSEAFSGDLLPQPVLCSSISTDDTESVQTTSSAGDTHLPTGSTVASVFLRRFTITARRNLSTFPFPPSMSRKQRRMVEFLLYNALKSLDGNLNGKYVPLQFMTAMQHKVLKKRNVSFPRPGDDSASSIGGSTRDFPDARGVFVSASGRMVGLVNAEDHLTIRTEGSGSEVESVASLFVKAMDRIEAALQPNGFCFACSDRLGYLTSRLEDVGTGMHVSFSMALAKMSLEEGRVEALAAGLNLSVVKDADAADCWTFTTIDTLCVTETETLRSAIKALLAISRVEAQLRKDVYVKVVADVITKLDSMRIEKTTAQLSEVLQVVKEQDSPVMRRLSVKTDFIGALSDIKSLSPDINYRHDMQHSFRFALQELLDVTPLTTKERSFFAEKTARRVSLPTLDSTDSDTPAPSPSKRYPSTPKSPPAPRASRLTPPSTSATKPPPAEELAETVYTSSLPPEELHKQGVYVTKRPMAPPAHTITNPAHEGAWVKKSERGRVVAAYVFVDPISHTLHLCESSDRTLPHRAFKLSEVVACHACNKLMLMIVLSEVFIIFKMRNGETLQLHFPKDNAMSYDEKVLWMQGIASGFAPGIGLEDYTRPPRR